MDARAVEHDTHAAPSFSVCFLPYRATGLTGRTVTHWTGVPGPFLIESLVFTYASAFAKKKNVRFSPRP